MKNLKILFFVSILVLFCSSLFATGVSYKENREAAINDLKIPSAENAVLILQEGSLDSIPTIKQYWLNSEDYTVNEDINFTITFNNIGEGTKQKWYKWNKDSNGNWSIQEDIYTSNLKIYYTNYTNTNLTINTDQQSVKNLFFYDSNHSISNYAKGTQIDGIFSDNHSSDSYMFSSGGAIVNYTGRISNIKGEFINNYSNGVNYALGGAIFNTVCGGVENRTYIDDISGLFIGNYTESQSSSNAARSDGGAIFNYTSIENINANFISNHSIGSFGKIEGGAIANIDIDTSHKAYIDNINGDFISNYCYNTVGKENGSITTSGGAIYNTGIIKTINGNFIDNYIKAVSHAYGGAIHNQYETIQNINGNFIGNNINSHYGAYGGAIYNEGSIDKITGVFINNSVIGQSAKGGAIYNENGILNLIANTGNIEFTGNTANGVSNAIHDNGGTINLWASENADIIFNDRITSEDSTSILNINTSTTTLTANGKIILNEDMSGYTGRVNLYDGEIELQAKTNGNNVNTNKFFSGNINLSSGTVNILNNAIDNITVANLTSTENANLKFDADLSNNTSDNFTVTNNASGVLNLSAINLLGIDGDSGQIILFNNEKSPNLNILTTANYGGYEYTFTNSDTTGVLNYEKTGLVAKTLKEIINTNEPAIRSYSLAENEIITEDLGQLGGEQLTIFGNGFEINGNSKAGITVSEGQTLNIEKGIGENFIWRNFYSDSNGGILNISKGTMNVYSNIQFSSNSVTKLMEKENAYITGGLIYNDEKSKIFFNEQTSFINNFSLTKSLENSLIEGSVIYNKGEVTFDNVVNFLSNSSVSENPSIEWYNACYSDGGAIYNGGLESISTIIFKDSAAFVNNKAVSERKSARGGAIYNGGQIIFEKEVSFINNSSFVDIENDRSEAFGGAIENEYKTILFKDKASFISNKTNGTALSQGGAINNMGTVSGSFGIYSATIIFKDFVLFSLNKAIGRNGKGGAINNLCQITFEDGVNFLDNTAGVYGGAIFNGGITNLIANTGNIEFTGNTANGISNAIHDNNGTINLWASENADIIFNDRITSEDSTSILNINTSTTTLTANGKIILNEDMSGYTGRVNLYDGEIELQAKTNGNNVNTNKFFSGNINLSSGTVNILNNAIDNITIANLRSTENVNLKFDADLSNNTSDNFTITNSTSGVSRGELNLSAINLLGIDGKFGQIILFNDEISPELNILTTANYGGYEYTFTNSDTAGVLNYEQTGTIKPLKEVINADEPAIKSFSLAEDNVLTDDIGSLGGTQLTIFGNGYYVDGNSKAVITLSGGQSLNIENGTGENFVWQNFCSTDSAGVIENIGGNVYISPNVNFVSNKNIGEDSIVTYGGAILNTSTGTITIGDNVVFSSNSAVKKLIAGSSAGGAISNINYSNMNLGNNVLFSSNTAHRGGAVFNEDRAQLTIGDTVIFDSNVSEGTGGAVYNAYVSTMTIGKNAVFSSNTGGNGAAIFNNHSMMTIKDAVIFSSNVATMSGGAILNNDSILTITDGAMFKYNVAQSSGGAIYNNSGNIDLIADTNNIEFTGNTVNGISNAIYDRGGTINLWASENADIIFNDRIVSYDDKSILNINKSTTTLTANGKVILNEDMSGYTGQVNLYSGTIELGEKAKWFDGNLMVENANINAANNVIQNHNFNSLTINKKLNLSVDADLRNKTMDTISADSFSGEGSIYVKAINIIEDENKNEVQKIELTNSESSKDKIKSIDYVKIKFTDSESLKYKISSINSVNSKLYKYNVSYNNGFFSFINRDIINPILAESAVASSVGLFTTQSMVTSQIFGNIDNERRSILEAKNKPVLYASMSNQIIEVTNVRSIESGMWIRPYAVNETVKLGNFDIDNTAYGTTAGIDFITGENSLLSIYLGYAGSNQKYEEIKVNNTGYIFGMTGMLIKENWYAGITANAIINKTSSESNYGTDEFDINMFGLGIKAGYEIEAGRKWTIEPNLMILCGVVSGESYITSQGAKIDSQNTNSIIAEPQIKIKKDLSKGWSPYCLIGYSANLNEKEKVVADETEFKIDNIEGYTEYGLGINKDFLNTPWNIYFQATGRTGGRNGFAGNAGIKYKF